MDGILSNGPAVGPENLNYNPTILSYESHIDRYWAYIMERQSIWYRRFVLATPAPWTNDPILANFSFTNVYRELDKGTIYYTVTIRDLYSVGYSLPDEALLVATFLYRFFNRWETWECLKGVLPTRDSRFIFDWAAIEAAIRERAKVAPVFTSAHMVCAYHTAPGTDKIDKIMRFMRAIDKHRSGLLKSLRAAKTPHDAWKLMTTLPGVGPFNAYEVYSDLMYEDGFLPFKEDDWANAGPGAKNGLRLLYPGRKDWLNMMVGLRDSQQSAFSRLGLDFEGVSLDKEGVGLFETRWLTMRNIEHNLCEYFKYNRGSARTRFNSDNKGSYLLWMNSTT